MYISGPLNQAALQEASNGIQQLKLFGPTFGARQQCLSNLEPLICLYYVHLCDNGIDIGPSVMQCNHIKDVCDKEIEEYPFLLALLDKYLSNCAPSSPLDNKACQ